METDTAIQSADNDAVLGILYANFGCFALLTGHKLGVFELLATEPLTASEVASRLELANRPAEILLTTLAAQRLLVKSGGRFSLTPLGRAYCIESSPTYLGGMLDFAVATHSMCTVENLEASARTGQSLAYGRGEIFQEHAQEIARARVFTDAMHCQSIAPAMAWPKVLDLSRHRMMLDIAGGSGAHSIGALRHWPELRSTVFEMAPVSDFVTEYATRYHLDDRLGATTGNMWQDPFPPSEMHFYSQVYHDWPPEKCRMLTEKSFASLPAGGRIVVHELLLDSDETGPLLPTLMGMVMPLWTEGRQYSMAELASLLRSVGFALVHAQRTFGSWGIATGVKP